MKSENETLDAWLSDGSSDNPGTQESILDRWNDGAIVDVQPNGDKESRIEQIKKDIKDSETNEDDCEIIVDQIGLDDLITRINASQTMGELYSLLDYCTSLPEDQQETARFAYRKRKKHFMKIEADQIASEDS